MKKLFKPLLGLILVVLILGIVCNVLVRRQLSPAQLASILEEEISAEVSLDEVKLSPFFFPSRISLQNVTLKLTGEPSGTIPAGFPPAIQAEELNLAVEFLPLIKKQLRISELSLIKPTLNFVLYKDGGNSLEDLFEDPYAKDHKVEKSESEPSDSNEVNKSDKSLNKSSLSGFVAQLNQASLENGQANIFLEDSGSTIRLEKLDLRLYEIAIDLGALKNTNEAKLDLSAKISFQSSKSTLPPYFGIQLDGPAQVRLFDPQSGELAPDVVATFRISEDSYLDTRLPIIEKAMKQVQKLEKLGLKVSDLPAKATFGRPGEERLLSGHYQNGLLTLKEPLSVLYGDWELALVKDSWIHTQSEGADDHEIKAQLLANKGVSDSLRSKLTKLDKYIPKELRGSQGDLTKTLFSQERFVLSLSSTGELSSPKVRPDHELPNLPALDNLRDLRKLELNDEQKDELKDQAKDLLRGLFK